MSILSGTVQPPLLTLLSSTSSPPLSPLFSLHTDISLPEDSFITCFPDATISSSSTSSLKPLPKHPTKGFLSQDVIHIQSPVVRSTYIQAGISLSRLRDSKTKGRHIDRAGFDRPLGIELNCLGLQVRGLGRREMAFEIGLLDSRGREGVVRCSSFKKHPTVHPYRTPPLIHLPLNLPAKTQSTLTPWLEINLTLSTLIPLFQSLPRPQRRQDESNEGSSSESSAGEHGKGSKSKRRKIAELPDGRFASVSYLRFYANCRIRRIWFSADGERTLEGMGHRVKEEWGLYATEHIP